MSEVIQKFKREKDVIGSGTIKELVAECIKQRGEGSLMYKLSEYKDASTSNYVNALHTWSDSKKGRDYWDELNDRVDVAKIIR
jgi:hypothetical protein